MKPKLIPQRNFIKLLLLAGVPITHPEKKADTICKILSHWHYNLHPRDYYAAIEQELCAISGAEDMISVNRMTFEANLALTNISTRRNIFIDEKVIAATNANHAAIDIMHRFTGTAHTTCRMTRRLASYMNCIDHRQMLEALLCQCSSNRYVTNHLNSLPLNAPKLCAEDVAFYRNYFWNCEINGNVDDLHGIIEYLTLNPDNKFYALHKRSFIVSNDIFLLCLGKIEADMQYKAWQKIWGITITRILYHLRTDLKAREDLVRLFLILCRIEKKHFRPTQSATMKQNWRDKMDEVFANVEISEDKRVSIAEIINEAAKGEDAPGI